MRQDTSSVNRSTARSAVYILHRTCKCGFVKAITDTLAVDVDSVSSSAWIRSLFALHTLFCTLIGNNESARLLAILLVGE